MPAESELLLKTDTFDTAKRPTNAEHWISKRPNDSPGCSLNLQRCSRKLGSDSPAALNRLLLASRQLKNARRPQARPPASPQQKLNSCLRAFSLPCVHALVPCTHLARSLRVAQCGAFPEAQQLRLLSQDVSRVMVLEQLLHQDKQPERKKKKRAHPRCSKLTPPRVYKRKQEKLHPRTSTHTSQATVTPEAQRNSNRIWIRVYKLPAIVTPTHKRTHTSQATVTPEAQRNSNRIWIRVYKLPAIVTPVK
jgi:hypothetical protein